MNSELYLVIDRQIERCSIIATSVLEPAGRREASFLRYIEKNFVSDQPSSQGRVEKVVDGMTQILLPGIRVDRLVDTKTDLDSLEFHLPWILQFVVDLYHVVKGEHGAIDFDFEFHTRLLILHGPEVERREKERPIDLNTWTHANGQRTFDSMRRLRMDKIEDRKRVV